MSGPWDNDPEASTVKSQPDQGAQQAQADSQAPWDADPIAEGAMVDDQKALRDKYYSSGIYAGEYNPLGPIAKSIDAFSSGAQRAPLMGWDDEAVAGIRSLAGADYATAQKEEDAKKQAIREQNPAASVAGELAGSLATGGKLAEAGLTATSSSVPWLGPILGPAVDGFVYGGVNAAGEAKPGERVSEGVSGGLLGAALGGTIAKVGNMAASKMARTASEKAAQSVDELAAASNTLYKKAEEAGVIIKPEAADGLYKRMEVMAGRLNDKLRPKTAGIVEDIQAMAGKPLSLQEFDELRQTVGLAMKNADAQDVRTLTQMKSVIDSFAERASPEDISGDIAGFGLMKEARDLWARKSKTELIEQVLDLADVKAARYSQSGVQNAIRDKASQLYTKITTGKVKGFTDEETDLVRMLAKGEMTSGALNWLAKLAPRGVMSLSGGVGIGGTAGAMIGGPVGGVIGSAVPGAIGYGAAQMVDRGATIGARALRDAASTGTAPVLGAITEKTTPFIGGAASTGSSQLEQMRQRR